jgi:hypothetical protein
MGVPAEPGFPRLRRHGRCRRGRAGRRGRGAAGGRRSRVARIVTADGDLRMPSEGQAVTLTLADEVDISRGDVIAAAGAIRRKWPTSSPRTCCGWATSACCRAGRTAEDRRAHRRRVGHRDQAQDRRQHPGAPGRQAPGIERSRLLQPASRPAGRRSSPTRENRAPRRLHPDRPAEQCHGRRRHPGFRPAPRRQHPLAAHGRRQGHARARSSASGRAACGSPACPAPASRRSPTWSRSACWRWAGTPTCSTATTSATA